MISSSTKLTFAAVAIITLISTVSVSGVSTCNPASCASSNAAKTQVCGSNGVTYSSQCELELAQCAYPEIKVAKQGACITKCDQECGNHAGLICGSDGITYLNACHFDRAYCKDNTLTPMGYGTCAKKTTETRSLRDAATNSQPKYVEGSII